MKRCSTTFAQVKGCGPCTKVCPVQRYGLPAVLSEFAHTGRVLGQNTDDHEGYDWPLDGRHYGPGKRPRLPIESYSPPGFNFTP